jgi:hypothetical protein
MTAGLSLITGTVTLVAAIAILTGHPRRRQMAVPEGAGSVQLPRPGPDPDEAPPAPAGWPPSPPSHSSPRANGQPDSPGAGGRPGPPGAGGGVETPPGRLDVGVAGAPGAGVAAADVAGVGAPGAGGGPDPLYLGAGASPLSPEFGDRGSLAAAWPTTLTGGLVPPGQGATGDAPDLLRRLRARLGATRRRRELERAVPEALDVLRATVSAGASPGQGLAAAAELAAEPLAPVLRDAARASRLGVSPGRALADAGTRAECIELVTAGEALDLAEATGAPPGHVLAGVAAAASDRVRARQALMAATAEARLSARVIAGLGPAFLILLALAAPREVAFLFVDPLGLAALGLAIVFEAAGLLWAARIVRSPL